MVKNESSLFFSALDIVRLETPFAHPISRTFLIDLSLLMKSYINDDSSASIFDPSFIF